MNYKQIMKYIFLVITSEINKNQIETSVCMKNIVDDTIILVNQFSNHPWCRKQVFLDIHYKNNKIKLKKVI